MQMAVSDAKALALPPSSAWWRKQQPARSAERAEKDAEQREGRLDEDGDRAGRRRIEDAEPVAATLTPFGQGAPRLRRLMGMARVEYAGWMARELRARDAAGTLTGELPDGWSTYGCRKLRDLLADIAPCVIIDGAKHLEFCTPERGAGGSDSDDEGSDDDEEGEEDA